MSDNPYLSPTQETPAYPNNLDAPPLTLKQKLFSGKGRFSRSQYWGYGVLGSALFSLLAAIPYIILVFLLIQADETGKDLNLVAIIALTLTTLILYVPAMWISFAAAAKRFHDRGKSGWMALVALIPYAGGIWILVECGCLAGTPGPNPYGPDPLTNRLP